MKSVSTERLKAFSDGVFAIAITLLILGITVPEISKEEIARGVLTERLFELWPKILSYVISFAVVGIFWIGHHILFLHIKRVDRNLMIINILLLMAISFIPFPAGLLGEYGNRQPVVFLYGLNLLIVGILFSIAWWYGTLRKRFTDEKQDHKLMKKGFYIILLATSGYLIAVILSLFNPAISLIMYIIIPVLYVIPSPLDEFLQE